MLRYGAAFLLSLIAGYVFEQTAHEGGHWLFGWRSSLVSNSFVVARCLVCFAVFSFGTCTGDRFFHLLQLSVSCGKVLIRIVTLLRALDRRFSDYVTELRRRHISFVAESQRLHSASVLRLEESLTSLHAATATAMD